MNYHLHDNLTPSPDGSIAASLAELVNGSTDRFEGFETTREALFALIVAGCDLYVRSLLDEELTAPLDAARSLASQLADEAALGAPELWDRLDDVRYDAHLNMTLSAVAENLDRLG